VVAPVLPDDTASDDSRDYLIEVRFFSGGSCSNWTLIIERSNC